MQFFKTMAIPTSLYGSETWILTKNEGIQIQFSELKFLRGVKQCYVMDKIRNDCIRKELELIPILNNIENYRRKQKDHLEMIHSDHIPEAALYYNPNEKRQTSATKWID